jgi:hypothetical protein
VKEEIAVSVGISKANLYNIHKELRQHDLLDNNEINPKYKFTYLQHREISFRFRGKSANVKDVPRNSSATSERKKDVGVST